MIINVQESGEALLWNRIAKIELKYKNLQIKII